MNSPVEEYDAIFDVGKKWGRREEIPRTLSTLIIRLCGVGNKVKVKVIRTSLFFFVELLKPRIAIFPLLSRANYNYYMLEDIPAEKKETAEKALCLATSAFCTTSVAVLETFTPPIKHQLLRIAGDTNHSGSAVCNHCHKRRLYGKAV